MLAIIPYNEVSASATGTSTRCVECVHCHTAFCFAFSVTEDGKATNLFMANDEGAIRRAERAAQRRAERRLATEVVPVPCPQCGDYQPDMVRQMGRERYPLPWTWVRHHAARVKIMGAYVILSVIALGYWGDRFLLEGMMEFDSPFATLLGYTWVGLTGAVALRATARWINRLRFDPNDSASRELRLEYANSVTTLAAQ